ncbi:MAG: DUF86 domain-containing protein [Ruminococcus sp.]|jgi:uncharacterized protein with HEPN domain|nr:DUF86 domain-containing protein [Ruminococcus sp.]
MRRYPVKEQILTKLLKYCKIIETILSETDGTFESFENDLKGNLAISFSMQQIGELAKYLEPEFMMETREQVPWNHLRDMRNMYAHEYEVMELEDIYNAAVTDIPKLQTFCENYLKENNDTA